MRSTHLAVSLVLTLALAACRDLGPEVSPTAPFAPPAAAMVSYDATFLVTNTSDDPLVAGTLRQALVAAASTPGSKLIAFAIPGAGPHVIVLGANLPAVVGGVTIDGYTQPGSRPNALGPGGGTDAVLMIELRCGETRLLQALLLTGGGSTVRGLSVTGCSRGLTLAGEGGHRVEGSFIGVESDGSTARGHAGGWSWDEGAIAVHSPGNVIGGTEPAQRNLISGNGTNGVTIISSNNLVQGNLIGPDRSGLRGLGNCENGISLEGRWPYIPRDNLIGGFTPEARNVISGNACGADGPGGGIFAEFYNGVWGGVVEGRNRYVGNYIGPDVTGLGTAGPQRYGLAIFNMSRDVVGGPEPGAGNVISGNGPRATDNAVYLWDAADVLVQGNYIGVDATGASALPNGGYGIHLSSGPNRSGARPHVLDNVISANGVGIGVRNLEGAVIQGNRIGTDASGTRALGNRENAVHLSIAPGTRLGGDGPDRGNIISGNLAHAIYIEWNVAAWGTAQGNRIGVGADGRPLPNRGWGIITYRTGGWLVGGTTPGAGNTIAHNAGGILFNDPYNENLAMPILGNAIHTNGHAPVERLGIDLAPNVGPDLNDDGDVDPGPNLHQNFPVLTSVVSGPAGTTVTGTLHSHAGTTYRIEFFANAVGDPSGYGEGEELLGSAEVTTDAAGNAAFTVSFPVMVPAARLVTATATAPAPADWALPVPWAYTSEFSAHLPVEAPANRGPALENPGDQSTPEGGAVSLQLRGSDPDGDALAYTASGLPPGLVIDGATGLVSGSADVPGVYTVTFTVSDGSLNAAVLIIWTVSPANRPPQVDAGGPYAMDEGSSLLLTAGGSDPDGDAVAFEWDLDGDGLFEASGASTMFAADDGPASPTVRVRGCDPAGACATAEARVDVVNTPPVVDAGPDRSEYWGLPILFSGTATDASAADRAAGLDPRWSFGDGGVGEGAEVSHTYALPGAYVATFRATDKDGASAAAEVKVDVQARPTTIGYEGATAWIFGFPPLLSARLADEADPATAALAGLAVEFAVDGMTLSATTDASGLASVPAPTELAPGTYTVEVWFHGDARYGASSATALLTVTLSPGKVTGGALRLPGGARSGFNVQSDGTTLKGQLEYQDRDGRVHVVRMTGLGISPDRTKARFSGVGGNGERVLVYVEDNGEPGAADVFRIWIDGTARGGDGVLSGGNIAIHR